MENRYTKEEFEHLCKDIGIIKDLKKIDEDKIDLTIKPAQDCIFQNLLLQFNIPKKLPKKIDVSFISWTTECEKRFEEILKKKIKSAFYSDKNYSWFRLQFYPHNRDFDVQIKSEDLLTKK